VDPDRKMVLRSGRLPRVLSPNDEQAVEAALRIKDTRECKITIISLGADLHGEIVKKPIAMGADELILLEDDAFDDGDSWTTAHALARAIKKIGAYDMILCGRQAADWDSGIVGSGIAEILGLPSVTTARKIDIRDGKARVERVTPDGYEVIELSLPGVIMVSNELGQARYATIQGTIEAMKKPPVIWKPEDIGLTSSDCGNRGRRLELLKLFHPIHEGKCEMIEEETPEESAIMLARRLREEKVL
ncbi:electron transfer flavoprotein subunit beta/FixA family protein, partial [Thermodesulfobacteriota bacterium]